MSWDDDWRGDARNRAAAYSEASGVLTDAATRPLTSWQALRSAMAAAGTDGAAALDAATAATGGTADALVVPPVALVPHGKARAKPQLPGRKPRSPAGPP